MDNDIANSLSVLIGSVKGGMVIYLLFILAGLVPLAIAYFGIKFGWNNLMAMSGGSGANLHSDSVPMITPTFADSVAGLKKEVDKFNPDYVDMGSNGDMGWSATQKLADNLDKAIKSHPANYYHERWQGDMRKLPKYKTDKVFRDYVEKGAI